MSVTSSERGLPSPGSDLVTSLRRLHLEAGKPSARAISKAISIASHTTVAETLSGKRIPSRQILMAIVKELGGDEGEFQRLWVAAADRLPMVQTAPRQLPPDRYAFTGRGRELAVLEDFLASAARSPTVAVAAIGGMAGVGKTALALHWAHHVADRFPDGQLYLNLRGFDPAERALDPAEAIRHLLGALGVPAGQIPADVDARSALLRSTLAGRRVLLVLDDARDAAQIRPLLPGSPTVMVVVTSRARLSSLVALDGARPLSLDVLSRAEARDLLAKRLGPDRIAAEPEVTDEIIDRCGGLPLALSVVAARVATRPHFPLAAVAEELVNDHQRLDLLGNDDPFTDLRTVFSWSYRLLDLDAARLFRLFGLHFGPDISAAAVASLAALPIGQTRRLLNTLTQARLIDEHAPGRYALHDLLRAYARELAATDPEREVQPAIHRLFGHYLHAAHSAAQEIAPQRNPADLGAPAPGTTPETIRDYQQAMAWFTAEHAALVAAIDQAASTGLDDYAAQLAWALWPYLQLQGLTMDQITTQTMALTVAERMHDISIQAGCHRYLSQAYTRLGRFEDALAHLRRARDLVTASGDQVGQAQTELDLATTLTIQGRHDEALDHAERAVTIFKASDEPYGQARALNLISWSRARRGQYPQAIDASEQALDLFRRLAVPHGEASAVENLGYISHSLGKFDAALASYEDALELYTRLGDRFGQAEVLANIAETRYATRQLDDARDAWRRALEIFTELDHPHAQAVRTRLAALDQLPT